jgi:hypothetical protein
LDEDPEVAAVKAEMAATETSCNKSVETGYLPSTQAAVAVLSERDNMNLELLEKILLHGSGQRWGSKSDFLRWLESDFRGVETLSIEPRILVVLIFTAAISIASSRSEESFRSGLAGHYESHLIDQHCRVFYHD